MDYAATSQARHWSFTPAQIAKAREDNRQRVVDKLKHAGPSDDGSGLPMMLSVEDEVLLQRCWHYKLQDMCREESARTPERFTHRVMVSTRPHALSRLHSAALANHHPQAVQAWQQSALALPSPLDLCGACDRACHAPTGFRFSSDDGARLHAALLPATLHRGV